METLNKARQSKFSYIFFIKIS